MFAFVITAKKGKFMTDKEIFAPYHPGEMLRETLEELGVSRYRFAKLTGIAPSVLSGICNGKRGISVEVAIRIGRALGTGAQGWLNMQALYDTQVAEDRNRDVFEKIQQLPQVAALA